MKKEFGKLSYSQVRQLFSLQYALRGDIKDFKSIIESQPTEMHEIIHKMPAWADFYEMSYHTFLAYFLHALGLTDFLRSSVHLADPQQYWLDFMESNAEAGIDFNEISIEEKATIFSMIMACLHNVDAIRMYNLSMCDLIKRAGDGDHDSLLIAVLVDTCAITSPTIQERIYKAQLDDDRYFFVELAKAINKSKPRRPEREYDDVRYMLQALDEAIGLDSLTYDQLHDLLVDDLQLYPDDLKDSFSALKKLIQRRKKTVGT